MFRLGIPSLALICIALCVPPNTPAEPSQGWYWVAVDTAEIQIPKVDSLARRLGMVKMDSWLMSNENTRYYQETRLLPGYFRFTVYRPRYSLRSGAWDSTWAVGFQAPNPRLETFLASAYLQEVRPGFRDSFPAFREYGRIDPDVFNRRLWLSAGYAWQCALKDNAMVSAWQTLWIPFGYTVDGLAAIVLVAAALPNESPEQRASAALFAVGFTAFERLLMLPLGRLAIRQHNTVIRSGYRVPDFSSDIQTPRIPPQ